MKTKNLIVSIVSGDSEERFRLCLKSLAESLENFQYQIVVINNASPFNVSSVVWDFFTDTQVITNEKPHTFAENQNKVLREYRSDLILIMKDDVRLLPSTLYKLKICLDRHSEAVIAAPAFYIGSLNEVPQLPGIDLMRGFPTTLRLAIQYLMRAVAGNRFYESRIARSGLKDRKLSYAKVNCFLARREALLRVNGLDPQYTTGGEGMDLGHKIRRSGHSIYQAEEAKCIRYKELPADTGMWQRIFEDWDRHNQKNHHAVVSIACKLLQLVLKSVLKIKGLKKEPESLKGKEFHKILIYKTGSKKDFLMITPALTALRKRYPEARIILMGNSEGIEILQDNSDIDEIRPLPENFMRNPLFYLKPSSFAEVHGFLKDLLLDRWDLFISFQDIFYWKDALRIWLVSRSSGVKRKLGLNTDGKGFFLTHKITDERRRFKHATRKCLDVLGLLEVIPLDLVSKVSLSSKEEKFGKDWLAKQGIGPDDFVVSVYAGGDPDSLDRTSWPKEYFIEMINQLIDRHSVKVLMMSSQDPREMNWCHYIKDKISRSPVCVDPELNIKQIAGILKNTQLLIANDSDILHTALASGAPAIGIFGPTDYQLYGSYGDEVDLTALYRNIDCRPCVNIHCSDPLCMKSITPELVLEKASRSIESIKSLKTVKQSGRQ